jgi:hypothetical protein
LLKLSAGRGVTFGSISCSAPGDCSATGSSGTYGAVQSLFERSKVLHRQED